MSLALSIAAFLSPCAALADELEQGLATLWEVLWHQSGTPTRVVRWENDIRVRITGIELETHREYTLKALQDVAAVAGVKLLDVSDRPNAVREANLTVEITPNTALEDNQPCATYLDFRTETRIDSATIQMRARDAWRCAWHEAMHVMGVRGHPAGKTVLSYFPWRVDGLLPLDKVMLRAWYSPKMIAGMTPFEALPVLAEELLSGQPDRQAALQVRDRFYASIIEQMHAYANGSGDVPTIVKRSGKFTPDGVRHGRSEMSFFLGVAYQEGVTVAADAMLAKHWFERAASAGNRRAQARLGATR
jgi:hypothetical protein